MKREGEGSEEGNREGGGGRGTGRESICMPPRIISCCEFCGAMRAGGHARGVSQNGLKEVTQFHSR